MATVLGRRLSITALGADHFQREPPCTGMSVSVAEDALLAIAPPVAGGDLRDTDLEDCITHQKTLDSSRLLNQV